MGSIVIKDGDHLIPDDALSTVLKKFSKGSGLIVAADGQLESQASRLALPSMAEALKEINDVQCPLKSETVAFYFTNYPDKLVATDEQPFICLFDKGEKEGEIDPMLMCFIDGELKDDFEPDASGHTREYMAVNSYVAPKLQRLYAQVGDDLEDFLKLLEDPLLKRELLGTLFDGPGNLVLSAASGEVFCFGHKSLAKDFEWGSMSDPCGYGEVPDAGTIDQTIKDNAKTVLTNIKKGGILSTIRAGATAAASAIVPGHSKPDTAKVPAQVWARPPQHIKQASNNKRKAWYEHRCAVIPLDWKDCPAILMDPAVAAKEGCQIVEGPTKRANALPDGVHHVPEKKGDPEKDPSSPVPLISNKQQDYIVKEFLPGVKHLDANAQGITNPAMDEETKYPTFCDKAGLAGLETTFKWDYASILPLFKNAPEAAALLFINTRTALISHLKDKPKAVVTDTKAEEKPSTPAVKAATSNVIPAMKRRKM